MDYKKIIIPAIILLIIIILFSLILFTPNQTNISQTINYSDFQVEKTINLLQDQRIETYSTKLKNPVIGFLIIPKTIASDISQIKISGEFKTEIIQKDPIIKLEPKDLGPGNKNIKMTTQTGEKNHTSILLLIPYTTYIEFSETEKTQLNEIIKDFSNLDTNYFTIEESKKIMQEFSQNTQETELKKKVNEKQIFFSTNNFEQYSTLIQQIITKRKTPIIQENQTQNNTTLENQPNPNNQNLSNFNDFSEKLKNILNKRKSNFELNSQTESNYTMTINFKPEEEDLNLPEKLTLFVSEEYPSDEININFKLDNYDNNLPEIKISPYNLDENIITTLTKKGDLFNLNIKLSIPKEKLENILENEEFKGTLKFEEIFFNKEIKLIIKKNHCEQQIEFASRITYLNNNEKNKLITNCYSEKIREKVDFAKESFEKIVNLQQEMIQDINSKINDTSTVTYFSTEMQNQLSGVYPGASSYLKQNMRVNSKYFANMKLRELFTIKEYLDSSNCNWLNSKDTKKLNIHLIPENLSTSQEFTFNINQNSQTTNELKSDKNALLEYYSQICILNYNLNETKKFFDLAKEVNNYNTGQENKEFVENQVNLYENYFEGIMIKDELNSLFLLNKQEQADYLFKITHFQGINQFEISEMNSTQAPPHNYEKGWKYQIKEKLEEDYNNLLKKEDKIIIRQLENLEIFINYFSNIPNYSTKPYSNFYHTYFLKKKDMIQFSKNIKDSDWTTKFILVKSIDEFYKNLANYPDNNAGKKEEIIELGKTTKNALLEKYLKEEFFTELSEEIELINLLNGDVEEKTFATDSWLKLLYSPATLGEYYAIVAQERFGEGFTDYEQEELLNYQKRIVEKSHELKMLKILFEKYNLEDVNLNSSNIDFFLRLKQKYSTDPKNQKYLSQRIFIKYLNLEKQLVNFNEETEFDSEKAKEFLNAEYQQNYAINGEYLSREIYPIARIKLTEFIDEYEQNIFVDSSLVTKAKQTLESIKPKLTTYEKIENKLIDSFKTGDTQVEISNSTIDYRTARSIWLNKIDTVTDLRYWAAFGIIGKTWQTFRLPTIRTIERAFLSKLFLKNPTTAKILGSKVGTYVYFTGEKIIRRKVSTHILWQRILKNNILKSNGMITELYGHALHKEALKLAKNNGTSRIASIKSGITTVGGLTDVSGNKILVIKHTKPVTGILRIIGNKTSSTTRVFFMQNTSAQNQTYSTTKLLETTINNFGSTQTKTLLPALNQINSSLSTPNNALINSQLQGLSQTQLQKRLLEGGLVITKAGSVALTKNATLPANLINQSLITTSKIAFQANTFSNLTTSPTQANLPLTKVNEFLGLDSTTCKNGCSYPVQTSKVINDSSLTKQGKIAKLAEHGFILNMSRVESISIVVHQALEGLQTSVGKMEVDYAPFINQISNNVLAKIGAWQEVINEISFVCASPCKFINEKPLRVGKEGIELFKGDLAQLDSAQPHIISYSPENVSLVDIKEFLWNSQAFKNETLTHLKKGEIVSAFHATSGPKGQALFSYVPKTKKVGINIKENSIIETKSLNFEIKCSSPCVVNINEQIEMQSNLIKISKTTINESGKQVNLEWSGPIKNVTIRPPQPYEIFSRNKYLELKDSIRIGSILPEEYTRYINGRVAPNEALINFDNKQMLIITDRTDIKWTINGKEFVSTPKATLPKIKPVNSNPIIIGKSEVTKTGSFSSNVRESHLFENISTSSQKTKITIGRPSGSGPSTIPINGDEVPIIGVSYSKPTNEFFVSSGSRNITGRGNAKIHRNNGELEIVTNIPVNRSGHAISNARNFFLDEGDVLEVGERYFTFTVNGDSQPIILELNGIHQNKFFKDEILLGKPSSSGKIDVFVPGKNNPVINIYKEGNEFYAVSGSRNIRDTATIIHKDGLKEELINGTSKRYYFENESSIILSGKEFKIQSAYDGIQINQISSAQQTSTINFKCSSPCKWDNGSPVKIIKGSLDLEIKGNFEKVKYSEIVPYVPLSQGEEIITIIQKIPNVSVSEVSQIENALKQGDIVAIFDDKLVPIEELSNENLLQVLKENLPNYYDQYYKILNNIPLEKENKLVQESLKKSTYLSRIFEEKLKLANYTIKHNAYISTTDILGNTVKGQYRGIIGPKIYLTTSKGITEISFDTIDNVVIYTNSDMFNVEKRFDLPQVRKNTNEIEKELKNLGINTTNLEEEWVGLSSEEQAQNTKNEMIKLLRRNGILNTQIENALTIYTPKTNQELTQ